MKLRSIFSAIAALAVLASSANDIKYIFYFIGDGMGMPHVMGAQTYLRTVANKPEGLLMTRFPAAGQVTTFSASSPVTDSAAAGTALATGHKTRNGMLGMDADSTSVYSIAHELKRDGYGIGVCTSVALNDATPAAFYTHVPNRGMSYEIGKDAASSGFDFLAGAGLRGLTDKDGNPTDLMEIMKSSGYEVVRGENGLKTATADKIILLSPFTERENNIGMTIDSINGALTLPSITQACLEHLQRVSPDRFFMMVEAGNIDHAGHANDAGSVIKEILNFDQSIAIAYNFYLEHPDETLIIVTADHDTGGMAMGNKHLGYNVELSYIDYQRMSKDNFSDTCKGLLKSRRIFTWVDMKDMLTENFGFWDKIKVSNEQEQALIEKFDLTFTRRNSTDQKTLYNNFNTFAVEVFKLLDSSTGIGWTTSGHTGNLVPVYAIGNGSSRFGRMIDNTAIPKTILEIVED